MRRYSALDGSITTAMLILALLGGCGGGYDDEDGQDRVDPPYDGSAPPGNTSPLPWPDQKIGGFWTGVSFDWGIDTPGSSPTKLDILGLVAEDGRAYFIRDDWTMYWGDLFTGGKWVEGSIEGGIVLGAASFGYAFWDGSTSATGGADGPLIEERLSLAGDFLLGSAAGKGWWVSMDLRYDSGYEDGSSLSTIAGNYADPTGLVGGIHGGVLNIAENGTLFIQSASTGCVANGNVALIDAAYNAYEINFAYSNCGAADAVLNGTTFTGLATYEATGVRLIAFVHGLRAGTPTPDYFVFERR
jgi:hypothetical protein